MQCYWWSLLSTEWAHLLRRLPFFEFRKEGGLSNNEIYKEDVCDDGRESEREHGWQ